MLLNDPSSSKLAMQAASAGVSSSSERQRSTRPPLVSLSPGADQCRIGSNRGCEIRTSWLNYISPSSRQ